MPAGSSTSAQERSAVLRGSGIRGKCWALGVAVLLVALASLGIGVNDYRLHSPQEVISAFTTLAWLGVQFVQGHTYNATQIMGMCPGFYQVLGRLGATVVCLLCGGMAALAGSLYQMVFRNPIAAPTMLGVNSGVSMGVVILVIAYGANALYLTGMRYAICYIGAAIVLALVVALSLALGRGKIVTVDMLLIGSVVSALVGQFVIYYTYCWFDEGTWSLFNDLNEMINVNLEPVSYITLLVAFAVSVLPVATLRFRMNLVAFDPEDIRMLGADASKLRIVALVCGTIMVITAQVHVGTIAIVSLVVPFISRSVFGVEFKKQFVGDMLIGALLVLICTDVTAFARFAIFANGIQLDIPLGAVANIVVIPAFAWVVATQQKELV